MAVEIERNFHQKGNIIVMSTLVKDTELSDKEVIDTITNFNNKIEQTNHQIEQSRDQIIKSEEVIADLDAGLKKIKRFEDWAKEYQLAKVKNIVETEKVAAIETVDTTYKWDGALTDDQNKRQKYAQLQRYIATCNAAKNELANETIRKYLFEESIVPNPF
jgi:hypothetical protein